MGIGAPRRDKEKAKAPKGPFPFPIVGVVALPLLLALDVFGLRDLEQSWAAAAVYGAIAATVGALFAYIWFGGSSRVDLSLYFWGRLALLGVMAVVFFVLAHFLLAWPLLPTIATGVSAALVGVIAFMIAMGDI